MIETSSSIVGMTQCDECGSRYQVKKRLEPIIGKPIRCPKCGSMFMLQLEKPTPMENAAMAQSSTAPSQPNKPTTNNETADPEQAAPADEGQAVQTARRRRKRRSSRQVRQEVIDEVADGFQKLHGQLSAIAQADQSSEEQVRLWCYDVLKTALGYKPNQIDAELRVLGKRVDLALKDDGKVFMIIECKSINGRLSNSVRDQAVGYAAHLNAEWAVVTNGCIWKLYHVEGVEGKEPESQEVFNISLLDEDGVSDDDAECLYLLTARAIFKGETNNEAHKVACLSEANFLQTLKSESVIEAVKKQLVSQYKKQTKVDIDFDDDDFQEKYEKHVLPDEL